MKLSILLFSTAVVGSVLGLTLRQEPTDLTILQVGQGDCAVFRTAGVTVLIDAGPKSDRVDAGERLVVPALRELGVRNVDLVLLSHPDSDHVGGLGAVMRHFRVGRIAMPAAFRTHPDMKRILVDWGVPQESVLWTDGPLDAKIGTFRVHIDAAPWEVGLPDNDGSMFVRFDDGLASAEFSGDASEWAELEMMKRGSWQSQVMHVGHHGSRTSSCDAWIRAVAPKVAVVSCGRENMYGHPAPVTLARFLAAKVPVLRTDLDGTIRFSEGSNGFELAK